MAEKLSEKIVQEIAERGKNEVPDEYLCEEGFPKAIDAPPSLWTDTLLIDLSLLSSSSSAAAGQQELAKLRSALSDWGCFQVKNHGIETSLLDELLEVSREFFRLPLEEKRKCYTPNSESDGYGNEAVNGTYDNRNQARHWNDRLSLTIRPQAYRKLSIWPQEPHNFREILERYSEKLESVVKDVYKAMSRCLNLEDECFLNELRQQIILARFNFYPRCPIPDRVLGIKPHTDGSTITLLLQDNEVEGLHVLKDDQWYNVPITHGALFINLGDFGEVISNGIFKSAMHRVVTNPSKERISMAAFCIPQPSKEIGPIVDLVNPQQPPLYKNFTLQHYKRIFFESLDVTGSNKALDALKL